MTIRTVFVGALVAATLAASARTTPAAGSGLAPPVPPVPRGRALAALAESSHVLVAVTEGADTRRLLVRAGARLVSEPLGIWQIDGSDAPALVPLLTRQGVLRYAEPDRVRRRSGHLDQGDPLLDLTWHIPRVGADRVEPPGPGRPITILDTGLDLEHQEFATRPNLELVNGQSPKGWGEVRYHGTAIASIAGAPSDGRGTVGVYPESALRIYELADLEDSTIIAGIDAVLGTGPTVINISIGGPGYSRALYEAVMRAVDAGSVVVAAAGNDFPFGNPEIYPADYPHVVTVGATGKNDLPAGFSSASPAVDLAAPGVNIPVAHPSDEILFSLFTGTSFAAPTVSAAAAWIWTVRPDLDRTQVGEILRQSADDVAKKGFDNRTGFGLLDIPAALGEPAPAPDPLEPNDDVDLVSARGIFGVAKPALTIPGNGWSRLRARIDAAEDPGDVYRVVVPARTTLGVRLTSKQDVGVTLWRPETKTVHAREGTAKLYRLDSSDAPKAAAERVEWRNGKAKPVTVYLEVWLPGRAGASTRADYTLRLTRS